MLDEAFEVCSEEVNQMDDDELELNFCSQSPLHSSQLSNSEEDCQAETGAAIVNIPVPAAEEQQQISNKSKSRSEGMRYVCIYYMSQIIV